MDTLMPSGPFLGPMMFLSMVYLLRYIVIGGIAYLYWYHGGGKRLNAKLQGKTPIAAQIKREIGYSLLSFAIFGLISGIIVGYGIKAHTKLYFHIADYGWAYLFASMVLMVVFHDTYFYWTHRLMHHRLIFRHVHRVHHLSMNPTPWSSFAFHPIEAFIEAGSFVFMIFLIPLHPLTILVTQTLMVTYNVYGHLGYELYPQGWQANRIGKWINTSVSHNTHHEIAKYNYGLYFLFWDRLCGTLDPNYEKRFSEAKAVNTAAESTYPA